MDKALILSMVKPFIKNDMITYDEFDAIFGSILSKREQYPVVDLLFYNGIGLCDSYDEAEIDTIDFDATLLETDDHIDVNKVQEQLHALFADPIDIDSPIEIRSGKAIKQSNEILCALVQQGSKQAAQDICLKNQRYVQKVANAFSKKYPGNDLQISDLEQAGYIGLLTAAKRFDFTMGYAFLTYAGSWIMQSISREIIYTGYTIRLPVHIYELITKISKIESELENKGIPYLERIDTIADELGIGVDKVRYCLRIRSQFIRCVSLQILVGEDSDSELGDFLSDKDQDNLEDIVLKKIMISETIEKMMDILTEREVKVLTIRFGLFGEDRHTLEQTGEIFNVTRERIRQIEAKSIRKLQKYVVAHTGLRELLEDCI